MKAIEWSTMAMREQGIDPHRGWMDEDGNVFDKDYLEVERRDDNGLKVIEVDPADIKVENFCYAAYAVVWIVGLILIVAQVNSCGKEVAEDLNEMAERIEKQKEERKWREFQRTWRQQ